MLPKRNNMEVIIYLTVLTSIAVLFGLGFLIGLANGHKRKKKKKKSKFSKQKLNKCSCTSGEDCDFTCVPKDWINEKL